MIISQEKLKILFDQYGIYPKRSKGQNFLISQEILEKIVKAADLKKNDYVLEIGPGFGILTEELIKVAKKVLAVELDKNLVSFLSKKLEDAKNLEIFQSDILKIKNLELAQKLGGETVGYKVVANLPYNITGAVLRKFLFYSPKPEKIILLLQKEVAQRIAAQPGKMNLLALSVQLYGLPEILDYVEGRNFFPQPEVDSAIVRICLKTDILPKEIDEKKFWQLAKIGFSSPRKQLQNNLGSGFGFSKEKVKKALKSASLREDCRPQNLSVTDWFALYGNLMV